MTDTVRNFDFDPNTPLFAAIPVVVAALDDEGLALLPMTNSPGDDITSVLIDGVKRVIVPGHRIVAKP